MEQASKEELEALENVVAKMADDQAGDNFFGSDLDQMLFGKPGEKGGLFGELMKQQKPKKQRKPKKQAPKGFFGSDLDQMLFGKPGERVGLFGELMKKQKPKKNKWE